MACLLLNFDLRALILFLSGQSSVETLNFLKNFLISKDPSVPSKSGIVSNRRFSMFASDAFSETRLGFCSNGCIVGMKG
ncbi:unnamed protein product [Meloidogyne enterolobii]|uniref:Uncharacterized protein n=1 Tax=Meloidogyne enterolobii TaxID=390850 RepID=A0ACB0Y162_MELEN